MLSTMELFEIGNAAIVGLFISFSLHLATFQFFRNNCGHHDGRSSPFPKYPRLSLSIGVANSPNIMVAIILSTILTIFPKCNHLSR